MNYDTPFWDGGDTPGKVCFSSDCYERHEVNYFAQGMWAAANGDSLVPSEIAVVGGWKILNWIKDNKTYPSPFPSGGTSNWFEAGYNMYNVLNKNYNDLVHTYQAY